MKFYRLSGATFYDCINIIHQFIKSFLDNKMSIFEEYGAFKEFYVYLVHFRHFCKRDNLRDAMFAFLYTKPF